MVHAAEPVVWTNAVGVTVTGNSLTRGAAAMAWTAGASSVNVIRDGYGYVECTAAETNLKRMCGLSFGDTNQDYSDIDFALYMDVSGSLKVYENSSNPWNGAAGTYAAGDKVRVQVAHGVVSYLRNGVTVYTSTKKAQYPLRVDTSLHDPGATLQDVVVGTSAWTEVVGVALSRDTVTKTGAAGWNSGMASANQITTGDGYVEFTAGQNTTSRAAGLANGDTAQTLADIEYAIHLRADGIVTVSESGASVDDFGGYIGTDRFRVELRGGTVRYLKNGAVFYTSVVAPTYPLRADTAFDTVGGVLEDLLVEPLVWSSVTGATATGSTLVKTAGAGWNAGAAASNAIASGDGWLEATAIETNTRRVFGLESGGAASTWSDIDHAIELDSDGTVKVHESGVTRGTYGSYVNGDLLRVEVRDGFVRYLRNGTLLYTSAVVPSYPLHADTALYTTGATLHHVTMGDVVWLDNVGVEIRGNRLQKTAAAGWGNAGAYSTRAINSGFVEMVVAEKQTGRMLGLSHGNAGSSYTDIDYAIYPANDNLLYVYENVGPTSHQRGQFGSYAPGDRLKVRLQSGVVTYLKNDVVIYTSAIAPILPLRLDAALLDTGATIGAITYPGAAAVDTLDPPVLAPGTNTYTSPQNVTMAAATGATIRYTTNGDEPSLSAPSSTTYTGLVNVNTLTTLKARAFKAGYNESATASATYTFNYGTLVAPTLTPAQTFITSGTVTMSAVAGATVRYTTNGTEPNAGSTEYTGPITVDATTSIRAKAFQLNWTMSGTTAVTYTVKVATPVLSLASGTYAAGAPVTVTLPTPGATGNYTIGGVDPANPPTTEVSITSGGVLFAGNYTLKVRAYKTGLTASDVATATYTVTGALGIGSISAGGTHSLAALPDGQVWAWGNGGSGEVGTGAVSEYVYQPVTAIGLTGIVQVAGGNRFTLALRKDGQVYGFGFGTDGQLGLGTPTTRQTPTLLSLTGVTALAAGERHALALKADGTVWAWGDNDYGQLGSGATPPVAAQENSPVPVQGLEGRTIVGIAAGALHSVALDSDGRVWAWGYNTHYQVGDGTATHRSRPVLVDGLWGITKIGSGTGSNHTLAVRGGDGAVFAWGANSLGTLGDGTQTIRTTPVKVVGLTGVSAVGTSAYISTAVKADGTLWSWGHSSHVGDGGTGTPPVNRLVPVQLDPTGIVASTPGNGPSYNHALALSGDGVIWAWGSGPYGEIGDGGGPSGYAQRYSPVRVTEPGFARKAGTPYHTGAYGPGNHAAPVTASFTTLTAGASIYYTTNGSEPTTGSTLYSSPVPVAQNTTFKVKAFKSGVAPSNSATLAYAIYAATPVLSPPAGTYPSAQTVTITTSSPGAVIRYTTDASAPTESSTQYTGPLSISEQTSLQVKAYHPSMLPSSTAYATYYFNVVGSAPAFAPAPGTHVGPVSVTITGPAGATIRYTTDGSEPALTSTVYSVPVVVSATTTLKAKAWSSGQAPSATTTGVYTIQLATPTLTPVGGSVPAGQAVTLGHVDPAVQLRYTTDGVDPSNAPTETVVAPGTAITINAGLTLKVRAYKTGTTPSAIASGVYTVTGSAASPGVIATGGQSTMFAKPDGTAWMWGVNSSGQLGNGSASLRLSPTQVAELSGITSLDGGVGHGVVRKSDGTVWTSGNNGYGQLGIGTTTGGRTSYAALTHAALTTPNSVASITSGWNHTLALRTDGTVWAWGANNVGQLGNGGGTTPQGSPVQVGPSGTPLTSVVQVAAARDFSLALKSDGTVWAWGSNDSGQLGNNVPNGSSSVPVQVQVSGGAALTGIAEVSAGSFHALARKTDGTVWTWGWNGSGQLGAGAVGTPLSRAYAGQVVQLAQVKAIAGGSGHSLAVRQDGSVWAWGAGGNGELGMGANTSHGTPQQAIVIAGIHSVAAGDYASAAVGLDGSVWAWGANYWGEVGDGTTSPVLTPKKIAEPGHAWTVGTPQFNPLPGSASAVTTVTMTTSTPGALIHYTTDGNVPTQAHPSVASGGTVVLNVSTVLKARAYKTNWTPSAVTAGTYTLYVPGPTSSLASGTYNVDQTITLSHSIPGTEIRYTTDGTHPTPDSTLYTAPIVLDRTILGFITRGYRTGWTTLNGNNYSYTMKVGTAGLSVAGGAYGAPQTVTVTCVTPGAALRYTLDGS
ncbi:MAG: chitobiase/beta-hexosaminidase C-terminal domain-containing protein, partial [Vicinamibacteria bacterium]